ncbi:hypothetical protein ACLKA6_006719 [Drosophila palustris]
MASPLATLEPSNSSATGSMVGVIFDGGIILAVTMSGSLIYYLDDRIYCCASTSGFDREALLDTASKLEDMSHLISGFKGATVSQALELLTKKYENAEGAELILAGEDVSGLHLLTVKSFGAQTRVSYAALGAGADEVIEYLKHAWQNGMNQRNAERLARKAVAIGNKNRAKVDVCFIFRRFGEDRS